MNEIADAKQIALLGSSLAIGLLIGAERGWASREAKEGERIAGLRTYGLIGLLGGGAGLLSQYLDATALGFIFLSFTAAVTAAYVMRRRHSEDAGITSLVAALLTFVLGSLATLDHMNLAASAAVVTALLLGLKDVLHGLLKKLEQQELFAALQLLLISIVILPVLPNQGYGPWQAFNPYEIWWMVVLIASISFSGYFAMKIAGAGKGVILTALFAGMASSTALTLQFSRLSRQREGMEALLASGILVACGTMFPRVLVVASLLNPALFRPLLVPLAVMALMTFLSAIVFWRKSVARPTGELAPLSNPLELKAALSFGALLALVILLGSAGKDVLGTSGLYLLAAVSGIADVDAINLTLARMSSIDLSLNVAALGIVIASSSNTLLKAGLAVVVGSRALGVRVFLPLLAVASAGLVVAWLT